MITGEIAEEYGEVCARFAIEYPGYEPRVSVETLIAASLMVEPAASETRLCRDPEDEKFLKAALATPLPRALLVTGDRDLLALADKIEVVILRPRALLDMLGGTGVFPTT